MISSLGPILISFTVFISVGLLTAMMLDLVYKGYTQYRDRYLLKTSQSLDQMFMFYTAEQIFNLSLISLGLCGMLGFILTFKVIFAIAFATLGYFIPKMVIAQLKSNRLKKFDEQLVPVLDSVANSFSAGFTLLQAMDLVADEQPPPISQEFGLMLQEHKLGRHLDESLQNMAARVGSDDLNLVVNSLVIARGVGGNLTEMLSTIANTIRERNRLEGKIKALTSQGKLQGIVVGSMPLFLGLIIYKMQPQTMGLLFNHWIGYVLISLVVILEFFGAIFIKKIISIDV